MLEEKYDGSFAPKLKAIAKHLNTTMVGFANMLGVSDRTMASWTSPSIKQEPKLGLFKKILVLLPKLNPMWFFFDDPEMFVKDDIDLKMEFLEKERELSIRTEELSKYQAEHLTFIDKYVKSMERIMELEKELQNAPSHPQLTIKFGTHAPLEGVKDIVTR